ncbi:MATE family efflux transporter [Aliamphritea spongicola]|uniref:MATE family efflux transporter n=1 Tax=Aliamphritea spongicola TaxID=707589 RepID=UPI00196A78C6|nr:MATE family efflux transporter [Aliamphritea spongicola]
MNPTPLSKRLSEIKTILILGLPIIIAQLSQTAIGFVDTLMAARVSAEDLAAVALGSSFWLPILLSMGGILMATTPLVAHHVGAGEEKETRVQFQQGQWIALCLTVIAIILLNNNTALLEYMDIHGSLLAKTQAYLSALSWGVPAILFYQVIRSYCEGFGKTRPIMKIGILALLCNIPLNYIFIYGKLGLPAMGGVGCGWASAIVMWIMAIASSLYISKSELFKPIKLFNQWQNPQRKPLGSILRLGIPIGFTLLIEVSMFSVIALLVARLGEVVVAAHQITISFTGMIFMLPLSIAMAITIRVGQQLGAKNREGARFTATSGLLLTGSFSVVSCSFMYLMATPIAQMYTPLTDVVVLASSLIVIAAIFQFSDAIQVVAAGALRGYKDTSVPLLVVFVAYWLIGLPSGYILGLTDLLVPAMGAAGFWYGLVIGLTVAAILLPWRLFRLAR